MGRADFPVPVGYPAARAVPGRSLQRRHPRGGFSRLVADGEVVGHIELDAIDRRNRSARISRVLIADVWRGRGSGSSMVRALLEFGFGELGLHRIDLVVFDFNLTAIACYEKAGFVREGQIRDARRMGDDYWSLYQMSMLENEWRNRPRAR